MESKGHVDRVRWRRSFWGAPPGRRRCTILGPVHPAEIRGEDSRPGRSRSFAIRRVRNADGSLTIWLGPTLPAGAPASNWIPSPCTAYFEGIYPGQSVSTTFQLMMRMYYPAPGDAPPSILPYNTNGPRLPESYIPPAVALVSG